MSKNPMDVHVGSRVRSRRSDLGMSQEALGKRIGVTFQQVQKYEKGITRIGAGRLFDLSKILNVPVTYFFGDFSTGAQAAGFAEERTEFQHEPADSKDTMTLVRSFNSIRDKNLRKEILRLVKAFANESRNERLKKKTKGLFLFTTE